MQTADPTSSSQTVVEPHSLQLTDMQGRKTGNLRRLDGLDPIADILIFAKKVDCRTAEIEQY